MTDGLPRSGTRCFIAVPVYGNSGHQRVNILLYAALRYGLAAVVHIVLKSVSQSLEISPLEYFNLRLSCVVMTVTLCKNWRIDTIRLYSVSDTMR